MPDAAMSSQSSLISLSSTLPRDQEHGRFVHIIKYVTTYTYSFVYFCQDKLEQLTTRFMEGLVRIGASSVVVTRSLATENATGNNNSIWKFWTAIHSPNSTNTSGLVWPRHASGFIRLVPRVWHYNIITHPGVTTV